MHDLNKALRVLDCKATDHAYLHKDFHGALCYAIKYLDDNYTPAATREYLAGVGRNCFAPLSQNLKAEGLPALEKHWNEIFTKEGGKFTLEYRDRVLGADRPRMPGHRALEENRPAFHTPLLRDDRGGQRNRLRRGRLRLFNTVRAGRRPVRANVLEGEGVRR